MKLLLVDDEEYVIESIKRNLDLTETGVNEVYTAFSVQQAKNIMGMVDIDIVISDIVMPGGTGFDFVEWVRKEELKVQVIFLTSYAEFDYARRAIQLNSVDYLLKPIDFDKLKEAVQRAAESVAKEKKIQDLRQESIKWNQNRKILQQDIWKNVLKDGFSEEKFCETAAQRQLPYGPGHYFRLICLMPEIKSNKREMWDTATMEFVIENVLSELYEETDIAVDTVFYQEPGSYWIVTQSKEKAFPQDGERDCEILRQFVAWMNEKIYLELWCGVGQWESVLGMQKQSRNLQKMREGSLSVRNEVLFLNEFQAPQTSYENKELDVWKALLSEEKPEELLERLQKYLDRTEREGMITRELLVALRTDLTQVVYAWLSEREIKAYALFAEPSRVHPGSFYALPQSPQLFKQLLMCSGYDRYIQIVKCFRDEDLRADRQPEFTQIDMELAFVDVDDVIDVNERLLAHLFKEVLGVEVQLPIQRMTWKEAMNRFGSDKPDLRFGMELVDVSETVKDTEFVVFKGALENGGFEGRYAF